MKKILLILSSFILAIIGLSFVQAAGTDTAISRFLMPGCEDQTLPYFCSISETRGIPYYCVESESDLLLITNCTNCGCPPQNHITAIWCNKANNNCQDPGSQCSGCVGKSVNDCKDCLGVCYLDGTACKKCPDKTTGQIDCSFYGTGNTCAEDMCFLGKTGFGVGFYESPWVIVNYTCEWYGGSCRLGYNTIDPKTGKISRCKTTQQLGSCVNDEATLIWSKICKTAEGEITEGDEIPKETKIPCGKVASPLPFFDMINFIFVAICLSLYYSLRNKKIR